MSEQMNRIAEATQKLNELQKERADLEASALAHEAKAREDRRSMSRVKQDMEAISIVLRNAQVAARIETAEQAAEKARQQSEAVLAANVEKQKQLDELLTAAMKQAETKAE